MAKTASQRPGKWKKFGQKLWLQRALLVMTIPWLLYRILFSYVPLAGWYIAFSDYNPMRNILATPWQRIMQSEFIGLENFRRLLDTDTFMGERFVQSIINTFGQSILTQVLGFICAIGLSLMLHEVRVNGIKRVIQNLLYLPHFLSMVIVASLASVALALPVSGGMINEVLLWLRIIREPIHFLAEPQYFWGIVAGTHLWRSLGWNTIIYLAAMTSIDPHLYEAASIDGASRYRKMWHVTLACIKPTIVMLLIMNTGWLLASGFEIQFFLGSGATRPRAENIDLFIFRYGIEHNDFGLAAAAGILRTVVSVTLLSAVNFISGRLTGEKLF